MLLNENLKVEVNTVINNCGITKAELGRRLEMRPQIVQKILHSKYEFGKWVDLLDAAGYDVEVKIKKKKIQ